MRHLYLQIYLAFVLVALLCLVVAGAVAGMVYGGWDELHPSSVSVARLMVEGVAPIPTDGERATLDAALAERSARIGADLSLWSADGRILGSSGGDLMRPRTGERASHWVRERQRVGAMIRLADGRWLGAVVDRPFAESRHSRHGLVLVAVLLAMAAGCYPLARRITRRLEALKVGVDSWGAGSLEVRVDEHGRDEVAELARAFNMAAGRIEGLLSQQRRILANASHELRSPVARLRLAVELLADDLPDARRQQILRDAVRDTEELDGLITEVLTAARLEATGNAERRERVALFDVAAEEAVRIDARCTGDPVAVSGDVGLLRRMVRNLLENAVVHGAGTEVEVTVRRSGERVVVSVLDRGPGVPDADRERIFEPFYRPAGHREGADGGVGLGLAMVRQVARAHGGEARYQPRAGGGSQFEVELPGAPVFS